MNGHKPDFSFAHREEGFDNHIDQSIRGYSDLHKDIISMSKYFIEDNTSVVDIGCSTGKTIYEMAKYNKATSPNARIYGVEYAVGFENALAERQTQCANEDLKAEFFIEDIRDFSWPCDCSLVTSIFTLQFMPRQSRQSVVQEIYQALIDGGAFIFAEKTVAESARMQQILTFSHYDYKRQNFTAEDIMDKEQELRSMLKPNTWNELRNLLLTAGFQDIQPFWQNHQFVGAIAIK